ncbi:ThiF family adenylyltransferase [Streptomyces sp. NPDC046197]|uniref:ThiF family adenylyltransferase n=1 Tax=Streptomyces sp. NPDC046197 TaxID=3154337 RepID=UPI0033CE4ED9
MRIFGDVGQRTFQQMSVAIVGLGGIGILLTEYLARLGVGHLILVDDDTVDETNLPRLAGARHTDVDQPKTDLAQRLACQAQPGIRHTPLREHAECLRSRHELTQCDWIFLAADGAAARHWDNAVVQQYLIPATQVGVKIPVRDGVVGQIHAVTRPLLPGTNCLWCDGLTLREPGLAPSDPQLDHLLAPAQDVAPSDARDLAILERIEAHVLDQITDPAPGFVDGSPDPLYAERVLMMLREVAAHDVAALRHPNQSALVDILRDIDIDVALAGCSDSGAAEEQKEAPGPEPPRVRQRSQLVAVSWDFVAAR